MLQVQRTLSAQAPNATWRTPSTPSENLPRAALRGTSGKTPKHRVGEIERRLFGRYRPAALSDRGSRRSRTICTRRRLLLVRGRGKNCPPFPPDCAPVRAGAFLCLPPAATAVEAATANEQDDQNDDQQGRGVHVALPRWRCAPRIVLAVFRPTLIRWCLFRRRRRLGRPTSYAVAGQYGGILARPRPRGRSVSPGMD